MTKSRKEKNRKHEEKCVWNWRIPGFKKQRALHDIVSGLHSGIPICCIAYYVTVHCPRLDDGNRRYMNRMEKKWLSGEPGYSADYIVCPSCIRAGRFVKLHKCTPKCKGQAGATKGKLYLRRLVKEYWSS